jgi:glucosamine-6-phosphate deaminase
MSHSISLRELHEWCSIPYGKLMKHPKRVPLRIVRDSAEMGEIMARTLVDEVALHNRKNRPTRAIVPCGPACWYEPFSRMVNREGVSLRNLVVFHMDECLDWEGRLLPWNHPYNFRAFMEKHFYGGIRRALAVPEPNRHFLTADNIAEVRRAIGEAPIDITLGGWGQDGHVAYNQARRHPFSRISLDDLRESSIRVQENNVDTILALAHRTFGAAYQFVPPMSVTLGIKECLSARKVRVFSDTGAWKQTALRVALFSPPTVEYPMTLLQEHPNALITATVETAKHPIGEHPEWDLLAGGLQRASPGTSK